MHTIFKFFFVNCIKCRGYKIRKGQKRKGLAVAGKAFSGGDEWIRTTDSRIFSPMLYQLSYITFKVGAKLDI